MTDLSFAAQAVLDAFHKELPPNNEPGGLAAALRAAVAQTQLYKGNDCFGDEVWTCDSDELLAIAAELEGGSD